jgi:hypothetical protein
MSGPRRGASSGAAAPTFLTQSGTRAFEKLALADQLEYPSGAPSDEKCAFQVLLRESRGAEAFEALLRQPSLATKLYGLAGIWHRQPASFVGEVARLEATWGDQSVRTVSGCIVAPMTVREILYADGAIQIAPATPAANIVTADELQRDLAGGWFPAALGYDRWGCTEPGE